MTGAPPVPPRGIAHEPSAQTEQAKPPQREVLLQIQREDIPPPVPVHHNYVPMLRYAEQVSPEVERKPPAIPKHEPRPSQVYIDQNMMHNHMPYSNYYHQQHVPNPWYYQQQYAAPAYDMSHHQMAQQSYPTYMDLRSAQSSSFMSPGQGPAYYTPQNSTPQSASTSTGSTGSVYNPHTDTMMAPVYENATPVRVPSPLEEEKFELESGESNKNASESGETSGRQTPKTMAKPYQCIQCRKRKVAPGEVREGGMLCRKCCELEGGVGSIKRKTPMREGPPEKFVCTFCRNVRERRHFWNFELACRACYHAKKAAHEEKEVADEGKESAEDKRKEEKKNKKICDNCNFEQTDKIKVYARSKFNEVLCHNCFHYKLRNGVSRPLEIAKANNN